MDNSKKIIYMDLAVIVGQMGGYFKGNGYQIK